MTDALSHALDPEEREAVLGDIAESGATANHAFRDVLGLVVRRQTALWKSAWPWLTLAGLIIPFGLLLSLISRRTADGSAICLWLYANNWDPAFLASSLYWHDLARHTADTFLSFMSLSCFSWITGFALGTVSRKATPMNAVLFCLVLILGEFVPGVVGAARNYGNSVVFALIFYRVVWPLMVQSILVFLPALAGMRHAWRRHRREGKRV